MLILARREGQAIIIGDGPQAVTVRVLSIDGNQVRLGIDAADVTSVHRSEVFLRIHGALPAERPPRVAS